MRIPRAGAPRRVRVTRVDTTPHGVMVRIEPRPDGRAEVYISWEIISEGEARELEDWLNARPTSSSSGPALRSLAS